MLSLLVFANQNLSPIDFASSRRAASTPFPSRDAKPITATPLVPALTNRDARNSFGMRIYENCRVSHPSLSIFASLLTFPRKKRIRKSLVFYSLRTLPSSVSCKPCVCHSYENCGCVPTLPNLERISGRLRRATYFHQPAPTGSAC